MLLGIHQPQRHREHRDCTSNVDFNLNGHTITGPGGGADGTAGISVTAKTMVDIKGPDVISSFGRGIDFDGVTSSDVKLVTATGNFFGFVVNNNSQGNLFRENTSTGNAQHGFTLNGDVNNGFLNNVASNNGVVGILLFAGSGNQVKGNTTNGNGQDGILSGGGVSIGHGIKDNTASGNGSFGIRWPVQLVTMSKATRPRVIIRQIWWITTPTVITTRGPTTSSTHQVSRASSSVMV